MLLHCKLRLAGLLLAPLLLACILPAQSDSVDLLLLYGQILTVDEKDSVAQAVAIREGIIVSASFACRAQVELMEAKQQTHL